MKYDFIEIGTSNFDTLIEKANNDTIGISVEPLKSYLDDLPNKQNVIKAPIAISFDGLDGYLDLYYIPKMFFNHRNFNIPEGLQGCNSIGNYHPEHVKLKLQKYVKIKKVPSLSLKSFFEKYNVESVDLLKIDVEGGDCKILKQLHEILQDGNLEKPKEISFEANALTPNEEIEEIVELFGPYYEFERIDEMNMNMRLK